MHHDGIDKYAIEVKQKYNLKIPDAIIAGTALYLDVPLLTADTDFIKVKPLDIVLIDLQMK